MQARAGWQAAEGAGRIGRRLFGLGARKIYKTWRVRLEHFSLEIVYSDFSFKAVPCVSFQEKGSLLSYTHKPKRFVLKARCAARLRASAAHPPEHFKCEML